MADGRVDISIMFTTAGLFHERAASKASLGSPGFVMVTSKPPVSSVTLAKSTVEKP